MSKVNSGKKILFFPLLAIVFFAIASVVFLYTGNSYMKYLNCSSDISWAINNPRPEEFKDESFPRSEILIIFRKEDIAKWDAIHDDLSSAKKEASILFIRSIITGISGLLITILACYFSYKTYRYFIPEASKIIKKAIARSTSTQIRRFGILLLAPACTLLLWGIVCWIRDPYWGATLFDMDCFYGILSSLGVILFIAGVVLASGMAERLVRWIKQGN